MAKRVALVTGGNRGLGVETCRQLARLGLRVVLTSRDRDKGRAAAERLAAPGLDVVHQVLDVTQQADVERVHRSVLSDFGRIDVLVNNAGFIPDRGWPVIDENLEQATAFKADLAALRGGFETNALGAFRLCQKLLPSMRERGYGRVVNVSTSMAQLSTMGAGWPAYRISKAALNAVTRIFAAEVAGSDVLVNAMSPGWVRTDMGGPEAPSSVAEGVDTIVWLATLPAGGPTGEFFRDRQAIDW